MTYAEIKRFHSWMLGEITAYASKSPVYEGLKTISDVTRLSELPLTGPSEIQECFEKLGLEKALLAPAYRSWHTSGSTGKPKKVYYGKGDVDTIAQGLWHLLYLCGVRPWNNAWVLTAAGGETLYGSVVEKYGLDGTISTLTGEMDLIKALRKAAGRKKIDAIVGTTWLFLLVNRIVRDPKDFERLVQDEVKKQVKIPGISWLVGKYLLRGINYTQLGISIKNAKFGFSSAEALSPYLSKIMEAYPKMEMHDVFGATEQWVQAIQVSLEKNWLSFFLRYSIPEIASPEEIIKGKEDKNYRVKGIPWYEWKKGMKGELILTRANECLPLVRYPTGDLIEVMDPAYSFEVQLERGKLKITLPAIKALGRAADSVDFSGADESGNFLGFKVYARQINDALMGIKNVRWWELYHVKGSPGKFVFLIVPENTVPDENAFRDEIRRSLIHMFDEFTTAAQGRAFLVGGTKAIEDEKTYVDVLITRPAAYNIIDAEIKKRVKEGRAVGQLKPKRVFTVENEEALVARTKDKMEA
jgi:phenylacetate-coenzyme A ligase PaaK-like adenylate-forming protein